MLIRVSGYNAGVKEYLEEGVKNGRDYTRDELDERVVLEGDLNLTEQIYRLIPDKGQNRYTTFTLSFREDEIPTEMLQEITKELRDFIMYAYEEEEYNFYAEAHIPKIKSVYDKRTGEKIERKPHIHVVIPKINLLSGKVSDVIGDPSYTEKYLEAFQEYINQKYGLVSPRDHVRVNPTNAADVLSRYKGDDFRGKNREFKQELVKQIIEDDIRTREGFYSAVSEFGETKIRNQGKENEYIAVKLPGDEKFTNLKETIFNDNFITERKLSRPPLAKHVITERLQEWPLRSKEIKYIAKEGKKFRENYYREPDPVKKMEILSEQQYQFYENYGGAYELHPAERSGNRERGVAETGGRESARPANRVQSLSGGNVATDRDTRKATGALFLPGNARVHLEWPESGGDSGLRPDLYGGSTGGRETAEERAEAAGESDEGGEKDTGANREGGTGEEAGSPETGKETGGSGKTGKVRQKAGRNQAAEGTGRSGQNREGAPQVAGQADYSEPAKTAGRYPDDDPGTREEFRYTTIPELGGRDATFGVRNGYGAGNRQLGIPAYARRPGKSGTVADVSRNTQRLFSDSVQTPRRQSQARLIKRIMPRKPRNASYVAACLERRQHQNTLSGEQRRAIYRVDQKYYETRRLIISDRRLSNKDKTQLLAVLVFERFKAHQQLNGPGGQLTQEHDMGSENIRSNIKPQPKYRNTITGKEEEQDTRPQGAKTRFNNLANNLEQNLGERSIREKVRIITAADLYTRKSRLSENIHYLDKTSDKTLFIDTGKEIAVSKNGLSESAVAVALELAKEKFGSTLTVKGSKAFKNTAIEVVAQKGLDIHFTDKEMNRRLAERKAELAIEREGHSISSAESARPETASDFKKAFSELASDFRKLISKAPNLDAETLMKETQTLSKETSAMRNMWMSSDSYTPEAALDKACEELETELMDIWDKKIDGEKAETYFTERASQKPEFPSRSSEFEDAYKGIIEAYEYLKSLIDTLPADELNKHYLNVRLERVELAGAYISANHAPKIAELESSLRSSIDTKAKAEMASAQKIVEQEQTSPGKAPEQQAARPSKTVIHTGILIEHGAAPYQFKPDMEKAESERNDSYYVKLQQPNGQDKVVWGVTLEKAVSELALGDNVRLTNLGKEKVAWDQQMADGTTQPRTGERVKWEGVSLERDVSQETPAEYETYESWGEAEYDGPDVA